MNEIRQDYKLNTIYEFVLDIDGCIFPGWTYDEMFAYFKDGRKFAGYMERQISKWFPTLTYRDSDSKMTVNGVEISPDLYNSTSYFDEKTYTTGGCKFVSSSMIGKGRTKDLLKVRLVSGQLIYIVVDNTLLPDVRMVFVNGEELFNNYPTGEIPYKCIEEFFGQYPLISAEELNQYYTNPKTAERLYRIIEDKLDIDSFEWMLEPSAGTGAFLTHMPVDKRFGIDLDPKFDEVQKMDFFDYNFPHRGKGIVIGNPPFGQNSSLAVGFFNHAAKGADVIAFIVPRTFRKNTIHKRLDLRFHMIFEDKLPEDSFIFEGEKYSVPCVFQIWVKCVTPRIKIDLPTTHTSFSIVLKEDADFAFQRVGAAAGKLKTVFDECAPPSHFFIKQHHDKVLENMRKINFDEVKYNTAGNPSIGLSELVQLYSEIESPEPPTPTPWEIAFN